MQISILVSRPACLKKDEGGWFLFIISLLHINNKTVEHET
jgi:hypothetical protein